MTRFEKIKKELTIEKVAEYIDRSDNDKYCFDTCEKYTGKRYKCPYPEEDKNCRKCAVEWLMEEVKDDEKN